MADFQSQAMGLTGLTIDASSTSPSRTEFSQFLNDGVIDVTRRHILIEPLDFHLFQNVSAEQTSQGLNLNGAKITSVVRESGTNNDWRECTEIHPSMQGQAVATDSLYLATKNNPVYTILDNGAISVFPAPGADPNAFKVYYVNNSPVETDGTALDHASTGIKYFPNDKIYLVILYASIKSLDSALSTTSITSFVEPSAFVLPASLADADVSFSEVDSFPAFVKPIFSAPSLGSVGSLTLPSIPIVSSLTDNSISFSTTAPVYTSPVLSLESAPTISDLSITAVQPSVPSLTSNSVSFTATAPTYTGPVSSPDFSAVDTFISTDEDTELAGAKIQEISAQLGEYQANIQNQLNVFNGDNNEYQVKLQKALKDADLSQSDDGQTIQKYQSELQAYQQEVNKQVQEYQQNLEGDLRVWQAERQTDIQKFSADIQNSLNIFNKENTEYQAQLQISIQNAQLSSKDDSNTLQKYSADLSVYQAEVNAKVQKWVNEEWNQNFQKYQTDYNQLLQEYTTDIQSENNRVQNEAQDYQQKVSKALQTYQSETGYDVSKINADIQKEEQRFTQELAKQTSVYQSDLQKKTSEYQWMQARQQSLKQEYNQAFAVIQQEQ